MKVIFFVLLLAAAALMLAPTDGDILQAFVRSPPRPEAEPYFEERARKGPDVIVALSELIRLHRLNGAFGAEVSCRERLRAISPEDAENLEELVKAYAWNNRAADALPLAEQLVGLRPDRRDLRELLLELFEFTGRAAEGKPQAMWLLEHGVRNPRMARVFIAAKDLASLKEVVAAPRERARLLVALGEQKEAIAAYREHLSEEPDDLPSRLALARLFIWNGLVMEAAAEFEAHVALSNDPEVRNELAALYRGLNRIDLLLPHLPEGSEKADILLALGRLDEARALYGKLGRVDSLLMLSEGAPDEAEELAVRLTMPMDERNLRRLAAIYTWRKEFDKALAIYDSLNEERAIDLALSIGDRARALAIAKRLDLPARIGQIYLWMGELDLAIAQYYRVPELRGELPRLLIQAGRLEEAVRVLDTLTGDPYVLAELYLYAARGDRTISKLETIAGSELDFIRVERLARVADLPTAEGLYRLLLRHRPGHKEYLVALARIYADLGRMEEAVAVIRQLIALEPENAELHASLGLMLRDRALLERAAALGSKDPDVHRTLAELAYNDKRWQDAIRHLKVYLALKEDDYRWRFLLAELTGDPAEYERTWKSLPPEERDIRMRILLWRKDLQGALAIVREVKDPKLREALVDLLIDAGMEEEALALGLTLRQRAVLAIRRKQWEEAVQLLSSLDVNDPAIRLALAESLLALGRWREAEDLIPGFTTRFQAELALKQGRWAHAIVLLRKLDLKDPDIRSALASALYALGNWQEAEKYATGELLREIRGTYGPEASVAARLYNATDERYTAVSGRYRMYLSQLFAVRLDLSGGSHSGEVLALSNEFSADVERAEASIHWFPVPELRIGAGGGGWRTDLDAAPSGLLELAARGASWSLDAAADLNGPWSDSIEALVLGGIRHRLAASAGVSPFRRLFLLAGVEQMIYEAQEHGLEGETADEFRAHARAELRIWGNERSVGRYFYDLGLRHETLIETHLAFGVQYDHGQVSGSEELITFAQRVPETRMFTAGPSAGWAGDGWGVTTNLFVGVDSARDLDFGKLWGGSVGAMATLAERLKLTALFDYVSEQRQSFGGAAWTATIGLNYNF